jgi:periplasmic copper chaperone A
MSTNRFGVRTLAIFAAAGFAVFALPGTASAHVTAQPSEATKGGYFAFAFRVPNERPNAGTTKIEVTLPADHPLASVRTKPIPGWKAEVVKGALDKPITNHGTEIKEAAKTITWTAEPGTKIGTTEYQEFFVSVGPLPDNTDKLILATKQTYENGEVVDWNAPPAAEGADEPERPAPVIKLKDRQAGDDHHGSGTAASADGHATAEAKTSDSTARYLGGAGLAVGALGLGFGAGAVLRSRKKSA